MRIEKLPIVKDLGYPVSQLNFSEEVVQGEWKNSRDGLTSWGADSCLVLAAHNAKSSAGLLGHFSCVSVKSERIPELRNE
jgi:hypothetical protein